MSLLIQQIKSDPDYYLQSQQEPDYREQAKQDKVLDFHIALEIKKNKKLPKNLKESKNIFITGSTGYLGAFILHSALTEINDDAKIYALVRSRDAEQGLKRIIKNL